MNDVALRTVLPRSVLGADLPQVPFDHPFRAQLRDWLSQHGPAGDEPADQDGRFAYRRAWQRALAAGGWAGIAWPARYGGRDASPLTQFMQYEELALAGVPEPANTPGIILLGPTLMIHGSEELRRRFLPGILAGDEIWAQCFSEPDAGSDLAALRTRAELRGDQWVINGQKIWSTFAQYADFCFVLVRTDPGAQRHRGLTLLICPTRQPGVTIRPIRQISGDAEFCEVFFDDATAPAGWTVGEVGAGWQTAMTLFQFERSDQGYTDHGRLLVELELARRLVHETTRNYPGARSAAELASVRRRYVELWIRCQELRQLNLRMAIMAEAGEAVGSTGSVTNLVWGELVREIAQFSADIRDRGRIERGSPAAREQLASRAASIYSGTSEIQRNIVAERLLGLPR
jgi:alkylation response protein AidB-like acyl-CoA dehydrogenase